MAKKKTSSAVSAVNPEDLIISDKSSFSVLEAYKTLRTNVSFSLVGSGSKCIGIISANRGEGKSSVAINLAISFAQINKRVILLDCDMRLPTIASKLSIEARPGLSNYLTGDSELAPVIHTDTHGIDVIPSGNIPPDSTTLLESPMMSELIEILRNEYDYIILDFPPIAVVTDAVIMSKDVDGYLFVVRHRLSEFKKIEETLRLMKFADAKIIGFVYNGKSNDNKYYKKKDRYYNNYYYYKKR